MFVFVLQTFYNLLMTTQKSFSPVKNWIKYKCRCCGIYVWKPPAAFKRGGKTCSRRCTAITHPNRYKHRKICPDGQKKPEYKRKYVNGKSVRLHRYLMEQHVGRELDTNEHVHHIDGNRFNNRIDNLAIIEKSDHHKYEIDKFMKAIGKR